MSFHCLNDMWALHLPSNAWAEVRVGETRPPPRYGFSMIWSEDLHLSMFGGETHGANGRVSCKERVLLDDFWHFKIRDIVNEAQSGPVVIGEWQQEAYEGKIGPRSHYSAIFITQRYQEPVGCSCTPLSISSAFTLSLPLCPRLLSKCPSVVYPASQRSLILPRCSCTPFLLPR